MSLYTINEIDLEIDMEDYEFQKKYEDAFNQMVEEEKELQKVGSNSDITLGYCKMFYHLFDNIFGEGTGEKLFKRKYNARVIDETYEEFIGICAEQSKKAQMRRNKIASKYKPNRAQRRAKQ